jgi:hypothetical protein
MSKRNKGIVALFPAIIISSILIILCVGVSQSFLAFLYRTTIFDEKVQSDMVANSCVLRVLAKHHQDSHYIGGETVPIGENLCTIEPFSTTTSSVSVKIGDAMSTKNVTY